ncbi:uncharacterized protein EI90DRAFT_921346 [Cantharellus anzutake]|uniref:uncharacterized protein n=1 Tax=Cantharellus anzutake TaxID=1750568 RepID=UPI001905DFDF|nr:uncharacterized protein EI90DRAFT_921346 [Cantharellus anzutake]KAF8332075.1 hypothetical protein EI90DRAFT_921346 [Cantharellus anzutake]
MEGSSQAVGVVSQRCNHTLLIEFLTISYPTIHHIRSWPNLFVYFVAPRSLAVMQTPRKRATQTPSPPSIKRTGSGLLETRFDADVQSSVWHSLTGFEGGKDAKEMPRSYKGLVDTCFEEGHYESGIQLLDRLRSPRYIPTISHVRQLIYMALYPPPPPPSPVTGQNAYESPRKAHAKRQRRFLVPSADASVGATALLTAFMHTNHPYSVFRAIPSYGTPSTGKKGIKFKDVADNDETINREMEDSPIGRDARALGQVKDCWGLLEPGLVKSKDRREAEESGSDGDRESDELTLGNNSKVAARVVGKHSWGMLEVLIEGFEEDERWSKETKDGTPDVASQILLTQVPHAQRGQPWNVERPINVIFASLSPSSSTLTQLGSPKANQGISIDPYRAQLGIRLLKLLINAALATPSINPSSYFAFHLLTFKRRRFLPKVYNYSLTIFCKGIYTSTLSSHFSGSSSEERLKEMPTKL